MYIIARNITGPRLRCEALMVDKKSYTPWPPSTEDGWRRAYKFRDRLMAEVVRLELDPLGESLKVIEAVYIPLSVSGDFAVRGWASPSATRIVANRSAASRISAARRRIKASISA